MNARVALGVVPFLFLAASARADLLTNSGFETGNFTGWTVGGTSINSGVATEGTTITGSDFSPNVVTVRSGSDAAFADVSCSSSCTPEYLTLEQVISVAPNQTVSASFYVADDSGSNVGMDIDDADTQIFFNGVGILPGGFQDLTKGTSFTLISGSAAIGNVTTLDVVFRILASGADRVGLSLDDFSVDGVAGSTAPGSTVPEPTEVIPVAALLGLALMSAWHRTRRRVTR